MKVPDGAVAHGAVEVDRVRHPWKMVEVSCYRSLTLCRFGRQPLDTLHLPVPPICCPHEGLERGGMMWATVVKQCRCHRTSVVQEDSCQRRSMEFRHMQERVHLACHIGVVAADDAIGDPQANRGIRCVGIYGPHAAEISACVDEKLLPTVSPFAVDAGPTHTVIGVADLTRSRICDTPIRIRKRNSMEAAIR